LFGGKRICSTQTGTKEWSCHRWSRAETPETGARFGNSMRISDEYRESPSKERTRTRVSGGGYQRGERNQGVEKTRLSRPRNQDRGLAATEFPLKKWRYRDFTTLLNFATLPYTQEGGRTEKGGRMAGVNFL
jgi:hypothetical protein